MDLVCAGMDTPIGRLYLFSNGVALYRVSTEPPCLGSLSLDGVLERACKEMEEYFSRQRKTFTCPLYLEGTPFQKKVWGLLQEIPYGQKRTYGELAQGFSHPRPVGQALNKNPLPIFIPCHRVVGKKGLVGFGMGLFVKQFLLDLEGQNDR